MSESMAGYPALASCMVWFLPFSMDLLMAFYGASAGSGLTKSIGSAAVGASWPGGSLGSILGGVKPAN